MILRSISKPQIILSCMHKIKTTISGNLRSSNAMKFKIFKLLLSWKEKKNSVIAAQTNRNSAPMNCVDCMGKLKRCRNQRKFK